MNYNILENLTYCKDIVHEALPALLYAHIPTALVTLIFGIFIAYFFQNLFIFDKNFHGSDFPSDMQCILCVDFPQSLHLAQLRQEWRAHVRLVLYRAMFGHSFCFVFLFFLRFCHPARHAEVAKVHYCPWHSASHFTSVNILQFNFLRHPGMHCRRKFYLSDLHSVV